MQSWHSTRKRLVRKLNRLFKGTGPYSGFVVSLGTDGRPQSNYVTPKLEDGEVQEWFGTANRLVAEAPQGEGRLRKRYLDLCYARTPPALHSGLVYAQQQADTLRSQRKVYSRRPTENEVSSQPASQPIIHPDLPTKQHLNEEI